MRSPLDSRPDLSRGWAQLEAAIENSSLPPEILAWSRIRVRQLLGLDREGDVEPPVEPVADFIEMYFIDVHGISDEQAEAASEILSEESFVALVVALGVMEARARMEAMVG